MDPDRIEFHSNKGTKICFRYWWKSDQECPQKIVLVIHGIGMHGGYYDVLPRKIKTKNIGFCTIDLRGHGFSGGTGGILESPEIVFEDIAFALNKIQQSCKESKVILLGESMGGAVALAYALVRQPKINGLALIAPAYFIHWSQIFYKDSLLVPYYFILSKKKKFLRLAGDRLEKASQDNDFLRQRRSDKHSLHIVNIEYLLSINKFIDLIKRNISNKIDFPLLLMHGEKDRVIAPIGSSVIFNKLDESKANFVKIPNAWHTLFWDTQTDKVMNQIEEWVGAI